MVDMLLHSHHHVLGQHTFRASRAFHAEDSELIEGGKDEIKVSYLNISPGPFKSGFSNIGTDGRLISWKTRSSSRQTKVY